MTEHSLKPWRVVRSQKPKHVAARFIMAANNDFVGKAYGHADEPVNANARLMAASPVMLEALKSVRGDGDGWVLLSDDVKDTVEAAIEAAEESE